MATIELLATAEDLRKYCLSLNESELIGQQLVQQGGIRVLETLLQHEVTAELLRGVLDSLRANMAIVADVAKAKGYVPLFDGKQRGRADGRNHH